MSISKIYKKTAFLFLKLLSILITAILGIFCNCIMPTPMYGPAPDYGMPHADYKISGTVISSDQNLPIKGLSVSIRDTLNKSLIFNSTKTDDLGKYSLQFSDNPWKNTWDLKITDIDSTENGSFKAKDTIISIPESDLKSPDDSCNNRHGEKIVDIKVDRTN